MGLLQLLFGGSGPRRVTVETDLVWLSKEAKYAGIRRELARNDSSGGIATLLVGHFADVVQSLQGMADQYGGATPVFAVSASELSSRIASGLQAQPDDTLELLIAERHPLPAEDARILDNFAKDLPCKCRVQYHVALDDPLLKIFVNDSVRKMIDMLGMKEDEVIESKMVGRRIRQAQDQFAAKATGNRSAVTAAEWIEFNIPVE